MKSNKSKTINGLLWKFSENFLIMFLSFIIQIILARLLLPNDYGLVAISVVFINIANVFVTTGFSSGIVQKKEISQIELSSVFFLNLSISIILYLVIFLVTPTISRFYSEPVLVNIIRVQSLSLIFAGLCSVQNSILHRELEFKKSFNYKVLGLVLQGLVGVILAYLGFGVWALIVSYLVSQVTNLLFVWIFVKWKPSLQFSISSVKDIFIFSSRVLLISLVNNLFDNIRALIIGKNYNKEELAFYTKGFQIPMLLMVNTDGAINAVMFSALSKEQTNRDLFIKMYKNTLKMSLLFVFPMMIGLFVLSEPITIILLTEKWSKSIFFMAWASIILMTWPFNLIYQGLNSLGMSKISSRINSLNKTIQFLSIIISLKLTLETMMINYFLASLIGVLINMYITSIKLRYRIKEQLYDAIKPLICSGVMGLIIMIIKANIENYYIQILCIVPVGIIAYLTMSYLLNRESIKMVTDFILKKSNKT